MCNCYNVQAGVNIGRRNTGPRHPTSTDWVYYNNIGVTQLIIQIQIVFTNVVADLALSSLLLYPISLVVPFISNFVILSLDTYIIE